MTTGDLDRVSKAALADDRGVRYADFRRTLTPKYSRVWAELIGGYGAMAGVAVIAVLLHGHVNVALLTLAAAVLFGYLVAYVQLFLHEAAHYNLASERRTNDVLSNIFIGTLVGQSIAAYRPIHFDHHRHLGEPGDTERTYFDPLNLRFLLESVTGVKPLKVLAARRRVTVATTPPERSFSRWAIPLASVILNGALLVFAIVNDMPWLALAWALGLLLFYPLFGALRQLLEHRDDNASSTIDYSITPHGAVNRLFGDSLFARTFGGAGFNRHLLHHWEPQISYTRLADLDRYLQRTEVAAYLADHRGTYSRTFVRLFTLY